MHGCVCVNTDAVYSRRLCDGLGGKADGDCACCLKTEHCTRGACGDGAIKVGSGR